MATILRKLGGLVLLVGAAPFAVSFARAEYGPAALLLFCVTISIGACGLFLIITPSSRSRY